MPKDVNEYIVDDFTRHSIDLDRFSVGERNDTLKALRGLEKELVAKLKNSAKLTSFQAARTEALLQQTQATIAKRYTKIGKDRQKSLYAVYDNEKKFVVATYDNRIGSDVMTVFTDAKVIKRAVDNTLIQGAPSSFWWKNQSAGLQDRFESAVRTGILAGETNDEIARRVRGTAANNFTDGVMSVSKKQADALVRTSVQSVANRARMDTYEENVDIIAKIQQRSTLDTRTTNICKSYAGLTWRMIRKEGGGVNYVPVGHDKSFANVDRDGVLHYGPPRHWQCRSVLVPLTASWEDLATKPVKPKGQRKESFQKKFEARLKKRGFTPEQIARTKAKTRASMGGQVPRDLNYDAWLKTQSETVQIDSLGPERWRLWKEGRIKNLSDLTDNTGRPLTIDELTGRSTPTPKPPPKPKPPSKPVITDSPRELDSRKINFATPKAKKQFDEHIEGQSDEFIDLINKSNATTYTQTDLLGKRRGAFYQPGNFIKLTTKGWGSDAATFGHEYGHHFDHVIGTRSLAGTKNSNLRFGSSALNETRLKERQALLTARSEAFTKNAGAPSLLDKAEQSGDTVGFINKEINKLKKKTGLTQDDFRMLAPNIKERANIVQAIRDKNAQAFIDNFAPLFDVRASNASSTKADLSDYFGSITNNLLGRGHSKNYYSQMTKRNTAGEWIGEGNNTEAFANFVALTANRKGGEIMRKVLKYYTPDLAKGFEGLISKYIKNWG